MKNHAGLLLLAWLLLAPVTGAEQTEIFPYDVHVETLDNGLQVMVVPMSSGGLVAYWTIVRTGARDEYEPGRTGFAHFFEHMMFRGTEKFPADVYGDVVTEIGADSNAFTSDDLTAYHLSIAAEDLETVIEIESDRFQNLSYAEEVFRTEAGAVYGEYRKNRTSPFFTLFEAVQQTAFETHTYGHTAMGYEEDIQGMPTLYDYSKNFFSRYYRPDNTILLIVGDVEVAPTLALVRKYYGDWQRGYVAPEVPVEPEQTAERRIEVAYDGSSLPILWLAYKMPAFDPANRSLLAAEVFAELYFGETSELYRKLVLEERLVESLGASLTFNRDPGLVDVIIQVKDPERVEDVLAEIDRAIAAARAEPPDDKRLEALKSRLKYSFLMDLDTPKNVASTLARLLAVTADAAAIETVFRTYEQVSAEDVIDAAREFFIPERRTVAILRGDA